MYVGAFNAGKMEGLGVMWWTSGNVYEGSWVNDMVYCLLHHEHQNCRTHGHCCPSLSPTPPPIITTPSSKTPGPLTQCCDTYQPHGKGTEAYANGSVYQGGFSNDRRSGYGAYSFNNGTSYGGQWSGGIPHGMGVQVPRGGSSLDDGELALFNRSAVLQH